jgi:hypothetical protein
MNIEVKDAFCPICGAPEVDPETDKLLVRGFKVFNNGHWWSQCISGRDHGTTVMHFQDGREIEVPIPAQPWFAFDDNEPGKFYMEIKHEGRSYDLICYGEEC